MLVSGASLDLAHEFVISRHARTLVATAGDADTDIASAAQTTETRPVRPQERVHHTCDQERQRRESND